MLRLFRNLIPIHALTLLLSELVLFVSCFVLASMVVLEVDPTVFLLYDGGAERILIAVSSILLALYFHDLYTHILVRSRILLIQQSCQVIGIAFLLQALLNYVNTDLMLPRWLMIIGSGLALISMVVWRLIYAGFVLRAVGEAKVLFLGENELAREMADQIAEHPELGITVLGYINSAAAPGEDWPGMKLLGGVEKLKEIVAATKPDRIVIGMRERRLRLPVIDLMDIRLSGIRVEEATTAFEGVCKRISLKDLRPSQFIFSNELGPNPGSVAAQTVYSFLIALIGTALTAPLMIVVAAAIRLTSPGPILFRQTRVGTHGRAFVLYKFRSMREDAEAKTGAVWATKDDPRVTPIGRWLRKIRLDELPQFLNVLKGQMSIVGPRPERPEFVETLAAVIPFYRQRHWVKPGITGWAQVNHKYGDTVEDAATKLEYDLYYIKNLSFSMDVFIILRTIKTLLLGRGAQ
ncbi:MAG: sugar transferase [Bryobacteraceae bacterium]